MEKHDRRRFLTTASNGAVAAALGRSAGPHARESAAESDICFMRAKDLATLIRTKKVSAREVMAVHLDRIRRLNPKINAIVAKLDDQRCLALAEAADQRIAKRKPLGPLHGLPIAFKDLQPAVGFP